MKAEESRLDSDALWQQIIQTGIRGYAKGAWILDGRPLSNLTEVLGIGTHDGLNRMMRMSGVDEAYITGGASDYDKLEALCEVLPLWLGHPYAMAVSELCARLTGMALSSEGLPRIWQTAAARLVESPTTYRDLVRGFGVKGLTVLLKPQEWAMVPAKERVFNDIKRYLFLPDLADAALWSRVEATASPMATVDMAGLLNDRLKAASDAGCCGVTVDLSGTTAFLRPNPYTPAQAVQRLQKGGRLTAEEADLITAQGMRLLGGECVRRQWCLTLINPDPEVWMSLCAYLKDCHCLPAVTVISDQPYETILPGVATRLSIDPLMPSCLWKQQISVTAAKMPLGCLGGLYLPASGLVDLLSVTKVGQAVCRCVAELGEACGEACDFAQQADIAKRILC